MEKLLRTAEEAGELQSIGGTKVYESDGRPVVVLLKPEEAAEALRIGRTRMYRLIREGTIRSVKVGQSRRIPVQALHDYVTKLELAACPHERGSAGREVVAPDTYDGRSRPIDRRGCREGR